CVHGADDRARFCACVTDLQCHGPQSTPTVRHRPLKAARSANDRKSANNPGNRDRSSEATSELHACGVFVTVAESIDPGESNGGRTCADYRTHSIWNAACLKKSVSQPESIARRADQASRASCAIPADLVELSGCPVGLPNN